MKEIFSASDLARRRTEVLNRARTDGAAFVRDTDGAALVLLPAASLHGAASAQRCAELLCEVVLGEHPLVRDWEPARAHQFQVDLAHATRRALALGSFEPVEALLLATRPVADDPTDLEQLRRAAELIGRT